jgi:hypothetical protein
MVFDEALEVLYRTPHAEFVATRKRLCVVLSGEGDANGASRLAKLARPPLSAWVVNQLWWTSRRQFDVMLATAARLRAGDSSAGPPHEVALAKLRAHAAAVLSGSGHTATESMLRRVMQTLAALAVEGGFSPDPPGALGGDRDPPFSDNTVTRVGSAPTSVEDPEPEEPIRRERPKPPPPPPPRIANNRVHPHVEAFSEDEVRTSVVAESTMLEAALDTARQTIEANERERAHLTRRLAEVEQAIAQARTIVADVEARLRASEE